MSQVRARAWWLGAIALVTLLAGCDVSAEHFVFQQPAPDDRTPRGPAITLMFVAPLQTDVGATIVLSATGTSSYGPPRFRWTAPGGLIDQPASKDASYVCKVSGDHELTLTVSDDHGGKASMSVLVTCI